MEKITDYQIRSKVLMAEEHAYRAGRSTTALLQSSLDGGEVILCAFLYIEAAFGNMFHESKSTREKECGSTTTQMDVPYDALGSQPHLNYNHSVYKMKVQPASRPQKSIPWLQRVVDLTLVKATKALMHTP